MKHFIYLDTDYLHSFLAQIQDGHIDSITEEVGDQTETVQGSSQTIVGAREYAEKTGSLKTALPIISGGYEGKISSADSAMDKQIKEEFNEIEQSKQIVVRIVHDNVFLQFEAKAHENNLICEPGKYEIGKYVLLTEPIKIFDVDSFIMLMDDEVLAVVAASENQQNGGEFIPPAAYKKDKSIPYVRKTFGLLKKMLPSSIIMQSGEFIIPIKERFLRETKKEIIFKYGEYLKVFGIITKTDPFDSPSDPLLKDVYPEIGAAMNSMGLEIPTIGAYVLNPIAIYFEPTF